MKKNLFLTTTVYDMRKVSSLLTDIVAAPVIIMVSFLIVEYSRQDSPIDKIDLRWWVQV